MNELEIEETLYRQMFDYEQAVSNADNRFDDSEAAQRVISSPDGRLRYWTHVYIKAINLFEPAPFHFNSKSYQSEILRVAAECGRPDLPEKFITVRNSAWKAVVLMAERHLIGENPLEPFRLDDRRAKLDYRIAIDGSIDSLSEESAWERVRAQLQSRNREFLDILGRCMGGNPKIDHFVRAAILSLWVHPDYPLWLMQVEPARKLVEALASKWKISSAYVVTVKNYEETKRRLRAEEGLITNPKSVITGLKLSPKGSRPILAGYQLARPFDKVLSNLVSPGLDVSNPGSPILPSYSLAAHIRT